MRGIKRIIAFGIFFVPLFVLILAINYLTPKIVDSYHPSVGYPILQTTPSQSATQSGYPIVRTITASIRTPLGTLNVSLTSPSNSPEPSRQNIKPIQTLSPTEFAALATQTALRMQFRGNSPYPTRVFTKVNSIADLPAVVYNDPFYGDIQNPDFGECIRSYTPLKAVDVQALDSEGDYYILPFLLKGRICGLNIVFVNDGKGAVGGWSEFPGSKFPILSSLEAKNLFVLSTNTNITGEPILVYKEFVETSNPFFPFWMIKAETGETYYVISRMGIDEASTLIDINMVVNAKDLHTVK